MIVYSEVNGWKSGIGSLNYSSTSITTGVVTADQRSVCGFVYVRERERQVGDGGSGRCTAGNVDSLLHLHR